MARNRKSQSAAIRFGPALKALLLCLLIGGSGVGYVWQKEQIAKLGHQVALRERRLNTLHDQNEMLSKQLANMRGPRFLELRIREANLGLGPPQLAQVVRLNEPTPESARTEQPQYAAGSARLAAGP